MVFAKQLREGVRRGRIRCSVRIWQRLHVKVGGAYPMDEGHIVVDSIEPITLKKVTNDLARESGFESRKALLETAEARARQSGLPDSLSLPTSRWLGVGLRTDQAQTRHARECLRLLRGVHRQAVLLNQQVMRRGSLAASMAASRRPYMEGKLESGYLIKQTAKEPIQLFVLLERSTRQFRACRNSHECTEVAQDLVVSNDYDIERRSGALRSPEAGQSESSYRGNHRRIARAVLGPHLSPLA